jgi:hypothetical protein
MATVPAPAAEWIVQYLRNTNTGGTLNDDAATRLTLGRGLNALLGKVHCFDTKILAVGSFLTLLHHYIHSETAENYLGYR